MAKIDPSKIDNWESMSVEDRLKAVLDYEVETPKVDESAELTRVKNALNKASSDCAEYKRALREKQTEAERAEADRLENERKLQEELNAYRNKERISSYKANFMAAGYDADTAEVMAKSLPEGVTDEYFAANKAFLEQQKQTLLSEALNRQPKPSVGTPPSMADAEKAEMAALRRSIGL